MTAGRVISFAFGPILAAAIGFITLPFIAWYFSPEDVGRFSMFQLVLSLAVMVFSLALHQAYVREYYEVSDKGQLLLLSCLPGMLLLIAVVLLLEMVSVSLSGLVFGEKQKKMDYAIYIGCALALLINSFSHVVRMQERGVAFSLTQIFPKLTLLALIAFVVAARNSHDYTNIIYVSTVSLGLSALFISFLIKVDVRESLRALIRVDWALFHKMIGFSLPLILGGVAYWGLVTIDRIFIRIYAGYESLGIYSVAVSVASAATIFTSIFCTMWHPTVYRWASEGVSVERVQNVIDYVFLVVVFAWAVVGIFSCLITNLLPEVYNGVQYLLVACFAAPLLYLLSEATMVGIGITRKTHYALYASLIAFFSALALNLYLVPTLAEKGASIATLLSFVLFFWVRTEATSLVWRQINRYRMYLMVTLCSAVTVCNVLEVVTGLINMGLWVSILILVSLLYRDKILMLWSRSKAALRSISEGR